MESDSGLLRWLKVPFLYNALQAAVAATALASQAHSESQNVRAPLPGVILVFLSALPHSFLFAR